MKLKPLIALVLLGCTSPVAPCECPEPVELGEVQELVVPVSNAGWYRKPFNPGCEVIRFTLSSDEAVLEYRCPVRGG